MATLKIIRKRIVSVKNTQKITKAMKMVAAAKLRRAQQAVEASRPYAKSLKNTIEAIASKGGEVQHSVFKPVANPKRVSILVFTSNKGLCGGFNSNLLRKLETHIKTTWASYELIDMQVIGKKGRDFYRTRKRELKDVFLDYAETFSFNDAEKLAEEMIKNRLEEIYDEVYIVYNQFKTALSQNITLEKLLPISVEDLSEKADIKNLVDYIFEPSKKEVLDSLIPKYIGVQLYQAHLESKASELGSRMTAMDSATNNASDMISKLTLAYNRARQAAITTELMDIVNGAESIK